MLVSMISTLFKGDRKFRAATREVDRAVNAFTAAIVDLGSTLGIELIKKTSKIQESIDDLSLRFRDFVINFENHLRMVGRSQNVAEAVVRGTENSEVSVTEYYCMPFSRNLEFVGREEILASLFNELNHSSHCCTNRVALFGLGGVGKTQIALAYLHRHSQQYTRIYCVNASDKSSIETGLAKIAQQCIPVKEETSTSEIAKNMVNWLTQNKDWPSNSICIGIHYSCWNKTRIMKETYDVIVSRF
jgi:hypothetical protein